MSVCSCKKYLSFFKGSLGVKPSRSRGLRVAVCGLGCARTAAGKHRHWDAQVLLAVALGKCVQTHFFVKTVIIYVVYVPLFLVPSALI